MSVLDIFNSFRGQPAAAPAAPAAQAPLAAQNTTIPQGPAPTPNASTPAAFAGAHTVGAESPFANFPDLWKIDPKDMPTNAVQALSPKFNVDPVAVAAAAKQTDYAKLIPQELAQKALSGDIVAFGQVLNAVTQAATANAGMNSAKIMEAALASQAQRFADVLPGEVRKLQVASQVAQDHPIFSNPAAAPLVAGLRDQFTAKYPMATPQQISDFTATYLTDFVRAAGGSMPDPKAAAQAKSQASRSADPDWGAFFAQ